MAATQERGCAEQRQGAAEEERKTHEEAVREEKVQEAHERKDLVGDKPSVGEGSVSSDNVLQHEGRCGDEDDDDAGGGGVVSQSTSAGSRAAAGSASAPDEEVLDVKEFVEQVQEAFLCSICHNVMVRPHSCREGHSFCFSCISRWLRTTQSCPMGREPLQVAEPDLFYNRPLQSLIDQLQVRCRFAASANAGEAAVLTGLCKWSGKVADRQQHMRECDIVKLEAALAAGRVHDAKALLESGVGKHARGRGKVSRSLLGRVNS